jgi:GrpB-like predicted nucleotidyltransferase (UPF0157 family)
VRLLAPPALHCPIDDAFDPGLPCARPRSRYVGWVAEREPVHEHGDEPVWIAPYDPAWPVRFEEERSLLQHAIGDFVTSGIHHVGSTAVPGLDAKSVIDILAGVADLRAARPCIDILTPLNYMYAPYRPEEMLWFCKPHPSRRTHHLHIVPAQSARFRDELLFRDYLRTHPVAAADYARLKRRLAAQFRSDREAYTEAKTRFVQDALRDAG